MKVFCKIFFTAVLFFSLALYASPSSAQLANLAWTKNVGARKTPSSKKIYWVNDFGTANDSTQVTTRIIQKAIDACAKNGGGVVAFTPGVYIMGSIFLKSNVHLRIDK